VSQKVPASSGLMYASSLPTVPSNAREAMSVSCASVRLAASGPWGPYGPYREDESSPTMYVWWTAEEQSAFSERDTSATRHVPWQAGQPTARSRYTALSPGLGGDGGGNGGGGWETMGGGEGDSWLQELPPLLEMADT